MKKIEKHKINSQENHLWVTLVSKAKERETKVEDPQMACESLMNVFSLEIQIKL